MSNAQMGTNKSCLACHHLHSLRGALAVVAQSKPEPVPSNYQSLGVCSGNARRHHGTEVGRSSGLSVPGSSKNTMCMQWDGSKLPKIMAFKPN